MKIGKMIPEKITRVWKKEDKNFTPWLADNIQVLGDALGFELETIQKEDHIGTFKVDIVAETKDSSIVIIENQYGKTDHPHLGQLITYLTNREANIAVWICEEPRPEHITAINWLNEISPENIAFYLVRVQAFRINESLPAPFFTMVVGPSEETKAVGEDRKRDALRHKKRREFWVQLLKKSKTKTNLFSGNTGSKDTWLNATAYRSEFSYNYILNQHETRVEFIIDSPNKDENKKMFKNLESKKGQIENVFGEELVWSLQEETRVSKVYSYVSRKYGWKDEEHWASIQEDMIDAMIRLDAAFKPSIQK